MELKKINTRMNEIADKIISSYGKEISEYDELEKRIEVIINNCKGLTCYHKDIYEMLDIIENDKSDKVIYIDPPYINTTGYGFNFDCSDFLSRLFC